MSGAGRVTGRGPQPYEPAQAGPRTRGQGEGLRQHKRTPRTGGGAAVCAGAGERQSEARRQMFAAGRQVGGGRTPVRAFSCFAVSAIVCSSARRLPGGTDPPAKTPVSAAARSRHVRNVDRCPGRLRKQPLIPESPAGGRARPGRASSEETRRHRSGQHRCRVSCARGQGQRSTPQSRSSEPILRAGVGVPVGCCVRGGWVLPVCDGGCRGWFVVNGAVMSRHRPVGPVNCCAACVVRLCTSRFAKY